jgi:type II secretory pathway component PulJ
MILPINRSWTRSPSYALNASSRTSMLVREGFTLIETILALALSSFLLVVIFSLVESTVRYHTLGQEQVLASERLLGVLQDLRFDIRAVSVDPAWNREKQPSNEKDEPDAGIGKLNEQLQLKDLIAYAEPITLVGSSDWMLLSLKIANPRMKSNVDSQYAHHQVVWTLGDKRLAIPTHDDRGRKRTMQLEPLQPVGLWRIELPTTGTNPAASNKTLVAKASGLRLRYSDGANWKAQWDSATQKALPGAVEVTLTTDQTTVHQWTIALVNTSAKSAEVSR